MDATDWDRRYGEAQLIWGAEPNRFVVELTGDLPIGRALDLACGEGRNAIWLAARGWRVTALDFSPVAIASAQRLADQAGAVVDLRVADVEHEQLPEADLVLLVYLHLPPLRRPQMLTRAAAAVAPGGALVLIGHDRRNLAEGVGGPQEAGLLWTPDDVRDTGLRVEQAGTRTRPVGDGTALDTVALLRRRAG